MNLSLLLGFLVAAVVAAPANDHVWVQHASAPDDSPGWEYATFSPQEARSQLVDRQADQANSYIYPTTRCRAKGKDTAMNGTVIKNCAWTRSHNDHTGDWVCHDRSFYLLSYLWHNLDDCTRNCMACWDWGLEKRHKWIDCFSAFRQARCWNGVGPVVPDEEEHTPPRRRDDVDNAAGQDGVLNDVLEE